jgi:GrpB-like predicted nucleotidyltransferase (UPF0157 family)
MILDSLRSQYRYEGVKEITRIALDTSVSYNVFINKFFIPFKEELTAGNPEYEKELMQLFYYCVNNALTCMKTALKTYVDQFNNDIDLTATIFSDVLFTNPMIRNTYYDVCTHCAVEIYFKLREYGFLSDENVYVLENIYPQFTTLTIFPLGN